MYQKFFISVITIVLLVASVVYGWPNPPVTLLVVDDDDVFCMMTVTLDVTGSTHADFPVDPFPSSWAWKVEYDGVSGSGVDETETVGDGYYGYVYQAAGSYTAWAKVYDDDTPHDSSTDTYSPITVRNPYQLLAAKSMRMNGGMQ